MSQKHIPTPSNYEHTRQPIHFYAATRNSMHEHYPISSINSPTKYFSSRISPIKPHSSTILNRKSQTEFQVERVLNSSFPSKYSKLMAKIEMLEKNLNRINGQHESLLAIFERSEQLMTIKDVFVSIDRLKERLQDSRRNKHIEEKRFEARHQVVYDDLIKKFEEIQKTQINHQRKKMIELEQQNIKISSNLSKIKIYDTINSYNTQKIDNLKQNTQRYINQFVNSLRKESKQMIKKYRVEDKIKEKELKVKKNIEQIKLKLGELKCITQYEMFLAKKNQLKSELNRLKGEFENGKNAIGEEEKAQKINQLQLKFLKDEMRFVTIQSLDRLTFELAHIDSKFVKIIQKYETKLHRTSKSKPNSTVKILSSNKKFQSSQKTEREISIIQCQVSNLSHELNGLKNYFDRLTDKIRKMDADASVKFDNDEALKVQFVEFVQDFEEKVKLLNENMNFFKSSCAK